MQLFRTKKNMQREKTTSLSQHKATLMLFRSCSLETLDPRDFETSARPSTRSKHRAQHAKQQTSTTKNNEPIKKGLKKRTRFGSRNANAGNAQNGTIVE
jgi:hypothetical protein